MTDEAAFFKRAFQALRHDTRNLEGGLAVIKTYLLQQGDPAADRYAQYLDDRMAAILALGRRAEALGQRQPTDIQDVSLRVVIDAALKELGAERAKVSAGREDATLRADEGMAISALAELLKNAVEAGSQVDLTIVPQDDYIELHVSDNGSGVPELAEAHLFSPFKGARHPRGAGLGLPLARAQMDVMAGSCFLIETGPDGSTFALRFPLSKG
ncbi:MAG: sensor histidine kinase [Pseudomonadota bacterium]